MTTLDDHDRELIDGYKAAITPTDDVVQSNWEVIAELAERQSEDDEPTSGSHRWWWLGVAAAVVAIVSYVELRASTWQSQATDHSGTQSMDQATPGLPSRSERRNAPRWAAPPSEEPVPAEDEVPAEEPGPTMPTVPTPAGPAESDGATPADATARRRSDQAEPREPEPASVPDIAAEMRLLGRTRAAIAAGDFARALSLVDRYDREHPRGTMREEAAMLRVGALCEVGPKERWRTARRRFDRDFPDSPLRTHLDDDCFE